MTPSDTRVRKSNNRFLNDHRLKAPLGQLAPFVESVLRRQLETAANPLASASVFDLWEDPETSSRAYRADGRPFSVLTESEPLHPRLDRKMRWLVKGDIKAFRDREFAEGRAFSALSGVPLTVEDTEVDHHPMKFREIRHRYLWREGMNNPEFFDFSDWLDFHREAIGWTGDGQATGLRLLTKAENNRLG